MMRMTAFFFIACLVLLIILQGCANKHMDTTHDPSHSSQVIRSTPVQVDKPTRAISPAVSQQTTLLPQLNLNKPRQVEKKSYPRGKHPVFYSSYFIGGVNNGHIVRDFSLSDLADVSAYNCYLSHRFVKRRFARAVTENDFGTYISLQDKPLARGQKPTIHPADDQSDEGKNSQAKWDIAIAGEWNALPRMPRAGSLTNPAVVRAIHAELARHHLKQLGKGVGKVIIVDLDGDGSDEMIVEANSLDWNNENPPNHTAGYNITLLMQQEQHQWHSSLINGYFLPSASPVNDEAVNVLEGVYDIDGDGWMEIVCNEVIPETDAFGYRAYRVKRVGQALVASDWLKG